VLSLQKTGFAKLESQFDQIKEREMFHFRVRLEQPDFYLQNKAKTLVFQKLC